MLIIRSCESFGGAKVLEGRRLRRHWGSKTVSSKPLGLETVSSKPPSLEKVTKTAASEPLSFENGIPEATATRSWLEISCLGATAARGKPRNLWFSCSETIDFTKSPLFLFKAPKWSPENPQDSPEATQGTQRHA